VSIITNLTDNGLKKLRTALLWEMGVMAQNFSQGNVSESELAEQMQHLGDNLTEIGDELKSRKEQVS